MINAEWQAAFARVPELLSAHLQLSFAALALALLICAPLSIAAIRHDRFAYIALGMTSFIQTIPALALLALFYPILVGISALIDDGISALGFLPALLALTLYALLPILRNAVTGLRGVSAAAQEAADGLGMTAWQKLYWVELPLAAPTIMAGLRTAAVWTIGAATLSTTIGQASLGDMIFAGLQTQNWTLVLAGCLVSAALALTVDFLLGLVEKGIAQRKRAMGMGALAALLIGLAASIVPGLSASKDIVTIGAKGFSEQFILARLIGRQLEKQGFQVRYRDALGSAVVFRAVANDDIDVSIDYSGTIWTNQMKRTDRPGGTQMLAAIKQWTREQHDIAMAGALGFENTYAFAVRPEDARDKNLKNLDDLARISPEFSFGTDLEFLERPEWALVKQNHAMRFRETRSLNPTFMYPALASGEVDVISAFSSDGRIASNGFTVLDDDKGVVPAYEAMILLSPSRADDGKFAAALKPLIGAINVADMREANYQVDREENKKTPEQAAIWLAEKIGL